MPRVINSIGPNFFRNFLSPQPPGQEQQVVQRIDMPGVDGSILRRMGLKSKEYQFDTVVDCLTGDLAEYEFTVYLTSVGADPAKLIWNSYDYDRLNLRFAVMDVELVSIRRLAMLCGGLRANGIGFWDLRARWSGIMVPI